MRSERDDPSSFRWRLAATVGPEVVALVLAILFAFAILLATRLGSPSSNAKNRSADPTFDPRSSRSISVVRMHQVGPSTASSGLIELDPT